MQFGTDPVSKCELGLASVCDRRSGIRQRHKRNDIDNPDPGVNAVMRCDVEQAYRAAGESSGRFFDIRSAQGKDRSVVMSVRMHIQQGFEARLAQRIQDGDVSSLADIYDAFEQSKGSFPNGSKR